MLPIGAEGEADCMRYGTLEELAEYMGDRSHQALFFPDRPLVTSSKALYRVEVATNSVCKELHYHVLVPLDGEPCCLAL